MKLIQANIWGGRMERQLQGFFKDQQPDIACLQEAISIPGNGAIFISAEWLQECWPKPTHLFHSPMFSFKFMERTAHFGNAIISTLPYLKAKTVYTNKEHLLDFDFELHDYNIRNVQHVVIEVHGKKFNILNHHGHHIPAHKDGDEVTLRQMKQIGQYVDGLEGPVILTGDFNLAPKSESLEQINKRLRNLSVEYGLETTRNQLTYKKEICDYIFVNDQVNVKSFEASDELMSDHQALILEFDV